jgi:uncharacterized protein GlcG (DUF336 family)
MIPRHARFYRSGFAAITLACTFATATAQQPPASAVAPAVAAYPLDDIPEKMPFATPYGAPIALKRAQAVIQAGVAEAEKRGWPMNIAVVDSGASLVAFARMDGAQIASVAIAEHKARASAKFRRPTRVFEEGLQKRDLKYLLTLDDVIASRGGIPIIEDGKIIGAVGCSGATGSQDEVVCTAALAALPK